MSLRLTASTVALTPNYIVVVFCMLFFSGSFAETTGKQSTPGEIKTVTMVATSTLKTKSSDCISDLVERRYDQACIEKGKLTGSFCVFFVFIANLLVAGYFQLCACLSLCGAWLLQ